MLIPVKNAIELFIPFLLFREKIVSEGCGIKVFCPSCAKNALAVEDHHGSKTNLQEQAQKVKAI